MNYYCYPVLKERKCKQCGRNFIPAVEHQFKIGDRYFCKWTCYKHFREENPNVHVKERRR